MMWTSMYFIHCLEELLVNLILSCTSLMNSKIPSVLLYSQSIILYLESQPIYYEHIISSLSATNYIVAR